MRRVAVLLLAGALAGCGGGGRPAPPAPPSTAPPSTAPAPSAAPGPLSGRVVALDAGHDGGNAAQPQRIAALVEAGGYRKACNTVGTSTDDGYPEHAFTFDVVERAAALLRAQGATVVLTRTDDAGVGPCVDVRARTANDAHADVAVSVHADGGPASGRGFHVIAPALAPDGGNRDVLEASGAFAQVLRTAFRAGTGEPVATYTARDGLDSRADLAGLTLARVPTVFIECANMRNAADAALVRSPEWRQRVAQAVADAVSSWLTSA